MSVARGTGDGFLSFSLSLSLIPRNLLVFRVLEMGIEDDWGSSGDGGAAAALLARVVVGLPADSVRDLEPSRFPCF